MKAVHAIIAACFILLIALRAPFSRLEKVLVLLNYYLVFEYSVISRNYGIGLLLALIYVELRTAGPGRPIHFIECNFAGRVLQYDRRRDSYQIEQLPERLADALRSAPKHPAVLILTTPLSTNQLTAIAALGITARQSAVFTGSDDPDENFIVYDVADGTKP